MLDDIVESIVAVDLVVGVGAAPADLETAGVEDDGRGAGRVGAAREGIFHLTEVECLATRRCCQDAEDLLAGARVFSVNPHDPVVCLVIVLELLAEGDCLGTRETAEGRDA